MNQSDGVTFLEQPVLDAPPLLVALQGWIDAAGVAASAAQALEQSSSMRTIATFDSDLFIDYRARRPVMQLREGISERLIWPQTELKAGKDDAGRDFLLLTGFEPDNNWQRFSALAAQVCIGLGARIMVGLGAYPYATPHTRASRLSCTTPSEKMAQTVRYLRNSVDVPAGVEAVLEHSFHALGVPAIGLWVQVPHYISNSAYPAAAAALLEGVAETAGLSLDISHLTSQAAAQRHRLDELVEGNPEHQVMLRQLEEVWDATIPVEIPDGDELVAEVEQFLRDQDS